MPAARVEEGNNKKVPRNSAGSHDHTYTGSQAFNTFQDKYLILEAGQQVDLPYHLSPPQDCNLVTRCIILVLLYPQILLLSIIVIFTRKKKTTLFKSDNSVTEELQLFKTSSSYLPYKGKQEKITTRQGKIANGTTKAIQALEFGCFLPSIINLTMHTLTALSTH